MLQQLESIFEATPQAIVQFVYLARVDAFGSEGASIITFSFILSTSSIMLKAIADDKLVLQPKYLEWKGKIAVPYILRYVFRILEISGRLFTVCMLSIIHPRGLFIFIFWVR